MSRCFCPLRSSQNRAVVSQSGDTFSVRSSKTQEIFSFQRHLLKILKYIVAVRNNMNSRQVDNLAAGDQMLFKPPPPNHPKYTSPLCWQWCKMIFFVIMTFTFNNYLIYVNFRIWIVSSSSKRKLSNKLSWIEKF